MSIFLHLLLVLFILLCYKLALVLLLYALFNLLLLPFSNDFVKSFGVIVIDIFIYSSFKSLHKFFLNFLFNVSSYESFSLSDSISFLSFLFDRNKLFFSLQFKFSHLDNHLSQFCESLLTFMNYKR
jgi:hypothetical protein